LIRFTTSLTDPQHEWLNKEAERLGVSPHELLRRIVDWYREVQVNKPSVVDGKREEAGEML
jgi:hypothetical protein